MSKVFVLGALLGLCGTPLGCELVTGEVSHDFAGAGGSATSSAGEAGETSNGGSAVAGGHDGGNSGVGALAEAGAAGVSSSGAAGDSGAAGMPGGCSPVDDGNPCTDDLCVNGKPAHAPSALGSACADGGTRCDGAGACVACLAAVDCPGADSACQTRTCTQGACGFNFAASGTLLPTQTAGDCKQARCDGAGTVMQVIDDADVPNDSNVCTNDVCSAGSPSNPPKSAGSSCGNNLLCSSAAVCVGCNIAADCPGTDDGCKTRTCVSNQCGVTFTTSGTALAAQTAGDCLKATCDGAGNVTNIADNTDLPDDGNQCTSEVCTSGVVSHPKVAAGTACSQGAGHVCDSSGSCTDPAVISTSPASGSAAVASPAISLTFNVPMNPATLVAQPTAGACSGSVQVSLDNFTSCIAFSAAGATMSASNFTASFNAAPGLLVNRSYKIRVTTAAHSGAGSPLLTQYTQASAFTTSTPNLCDGSIVISQVYGGGGGNNPSYGNDFVELHNRGSVAVNVNGWAVQYADATGSSWQTTALPNVSIQPGAFFLVAQSATGSSGTFGALPTPDATGVIAMAEGSGKVALTSSTTPLTGSCAASAAVRDFVGYGAADCFAGAAASPVQTLTSGSSRAQSGCANVNDNSADFLNSPPAPHNSTTLNQCGCAVENEATNPALEANFCTVQAPLGFTVAPGTSTPTVSGQLYELGITDVSSSASPMVRAQLGYGPPTANPEYEPSWTWTNASFNSSCAGCGNNHEYLASFTSPSSVGSYDYAYRFSLDRGVTWTYCDADGAGSNTGLQFNLPDEPLMTVQ